MIIETYKSSRKLSSVKPLCLRISDSVPLASSPCIGATVLKRRSDVRFSRETWLPFWRNSTKPARLRARTTRSRETLGSLGMSTRHFDCSPERFTFCGGTFGNAPGLEVEFDGLAQTGTGALDIASLRSNVQLRAPRNEPGIFFGNQRGESVGHKPKLTDVPGRKQDFAASVSVSTEYELLVTRTHG